MRLTVIGHIFSGQRASYSYSLTEGQARALKTNQVSALSLAGDFSDVSAWELTDTEATGSSGPGWKSRTVTTRRLASYNWRKPLGWEG